MSILSKLMSEGWWKEVKEPEVVNVPLSMKDMEDIRKKGYKIVEAENGEIVRAELVFTRLSVVTGK